MVHPICLHSLTESDEAPKYTDFVVICPMCRHYSNLLLPCWKNTASFEKLENSNLSNLAEIIKERKFESEVFDKNDYIHAEHIQAIDEAVSRSTRPVPQISKQMS